MNAWLRDRIESQEPVEQVEEMKNLIAVLLLAFASGCVTRSDFSYRPCHELRTDMSVSNDEYDYHCPRRGD